MVTGEESCFREKFPTFHPDTTGATFWCAVAGWFPLMHVSSWAQVSVFRQRALVR